VNISGDNTLAPLLGEVMAGVPGVGVGAGVGCGLVEVDVAAPQLRKQRQKNISTRNAPPQ
jgi:hypothetical protein